MKTLKEIRESKGVKQLAVAEHLGISRQAYAYYEQNPQRLRLEQANAVCEFLHCDIGEFFLPSKVN